uniref:Fibrinogen-like protein A n=1 Tax=Zeugodacus cucurbitae TaxID=28588 RepID=A0A0A1X2H6_ZEUCU
MHQFKSCAQTVNASQSIMFPNFLKILLYLILIFRIRYCLSENNEQNATDACTCDVEIDVVREFMDDLDVVQKSGTKLESKMSNIEKLLIANRVLKLPTNCMEATGNSTKNGVYHIQLQKLHIDDLKVFCVEDVDFGGWLVIHRSQSDSVNYFRNRTDYKEGFGDLTGNYWIGLEKIYALTSDCEQELYIQISRNGTEYYEKYTKFVIAGESEDYALKEVGNYSGNAEDFFDRQIDESLTFAQMMIRPTRNCLKQLLLRNLNASA